jgi:nucleoside transporter
LIHTDRGHSVSGPLCEVKASRDDIYNEKEQKVVFPSGLRLPIMMFLQYFVPGAVIPILSHYLKNTLEFSPLQVGAVLAMPAVGAMAAPLGAARMADRVISAERLLALCHVVGGCIMLLLVFQTEFWPFLGLYLLYGLCFGPTFALSNAVAFHHVRDARRDFGKVRLWGTVGWIAVAWLFGFLWLRTGNGYQSERLVDALKLCGLASFAFAAYMLTMPTSGVKEAGARPSPWAALRVFRRKDILVFSALTFFAAIADRFYYFGASPYLNHLGVADKHIMPLMSLGQMMEVGAMAVLGMLLARFGVKPLLVTGMLVEVFRYSVFASGTAGALLVAALAAHGLCYTFYFAAAFIHLNAACSPEVRAGAQQLFGILITGGGVLGGSLLAGRLAAWFALPGGAIDYSRFWAVPAGAALTAGVLIALFFKEGEASAR